MMAGWLTTRPTAFTSDGLLTLPIAARSMQLLMEEGDCYILVGSMAHAGTRNDLGTESRKSLIFRLLSEAHNPGGPKVDRPIRDKVTIQMGLRR